MRPGLEDAASLIVPGVLQSSGFGVSRGYPGVWGAQGMLPVCALPRERCRLGGEADRVHPSYFGGGAGAVLGANSSPARLHPRRPDPPRLSRSSAPVIILFFVLFVIITAVVIITVVITVILSLLPLLPLPRQPPRCCRTRLRCCLRRCPLLPGPGAQVWLGHPPRNTPSPGHRSFAEGSGQGKGSRLNLRLWWEEEPGRWGGLRAGRAGVSGWDAPRIPLPASRGCAEPQRHGLVQVKLQGCGSLPGPDLFSQGYVVRLCVELGFLSSC